MTGFLRIYSELVSEWMDGSLGLIHHTSVFGSVVTDVYAPAYSCSSERRKVKPCRLLAVGQTSHHKPIEEMHEASC